MKKNGSWKNFFLCFRPIYDQVSDDVDCYILIPKMDSNSLSGRKLSSRRTFSGVLKSIVYEKSLSKKFKRRSSRGESEDYCDKPITIPTERKPQIEVPKLEPTPSPSSPSLESESIENRIEETKTECKTLRFDLNHVSWLLVVSLCGNVLLGKLVAMVLTTFWIYFVGFYSRNWKIRMFDSQFGKGQ